MASFFSAAGVSNLPPSRSRRQVPRDQNSRRLRLGGKQVQAHRLRYLYDDVAHDVAIYHRDLLTIEQPSDKRMGLSSTLQRESTVLSKSLQSLVSRVKHSPPRHVSFVLNCLVGLLVPLLAILIGHVFQALMGLPNSALSSWLPDLGSFAAAQPPLLRITWLLTAIIGVLLGIEILLFIAYRAGQTAGVEFEIWLIREFRDKSQKLARVKTLSAQETELVDCLDYHLPRVRAMLVRYWHSIPRHPVQFIACVLCACLIQLQFTLLAVIATALVVLTYQFFDRTRRTRLPVVRENAALHRTGLISLALRGPLLESVHRQPEVERRFNEQLNHYRREAVRSLTSSAWKTPVLAMLLGILACLLIFVIAVQLLQKNLQLPSALAFLLSLAAAVYSASRVLQIYRSSSQASIAVEQLNRFLGIAIPEADESQLVSIKRIEKSAELEHVTIQDSRGRKLLEDVSVVFEPGQLIGVLSDQPLESRALVEMLLGFGQPTSGRMLIDGRLVTDLVPGGLTLCSHWVASNGSLLTGSVLENLAADRSSVEQVLQPAQLTELVARLSDGLNTLITSDDDRLQGDDAFRLGLARAMIGQASVVAVEEPVAGVTPSVEQATLQALQSLVQPGRFVVALPQRINTIRQCNKILFVHQHKLIDIGTHAELVQRNELYRHFSYIRFNPFQSA
jgi:ATP-binding cassette, subfamily B, bacterial